ncbi:predicted protein, partial [Naegleria gruberi]
EISKDCIGKIYQQLNKKTTLEASLDSNIVSKALQSNVTLVIAIGILALIIPLCSGMLYYETYKNAKSALFTFTNVGLFSNVIGHLQFSAFYLGEILTFFGLSGLAQYGDTRYWNEKLKPSEFEQIYSLLRYESVLLYLQQLNITITFNAKVQYCFGIEEVMTDYLTSSTQENTRNFYNAQQNLFSKIVSTPSGGSSSDRELLDSFSNRSSVGLLDPLHLDDHPYYYQQQSPHQSSNILKSPSSAGQPHQDDKNNNIIILQSPNSNMPTSATSSLPGSNCNNSFKLSEQHDNNNTIEEEDEGESHIVHINNWELNSKATKKWFLGLRRKRFSSNYISTTKYTWWNFIILNLIYQLCKIGNIYFIITMIFALIPGVSPITPITAVLPVIFIIGVNMIREGGEDFLRYLNDRKINMMTTNVLRRGGNNSMNNNNNNSNNNGINMIEQVYTCDLK